MAFLINVLLYNNSVACLKMVKSEVLPRSHGPTGQHSSPVSSAPASHHLNLQDHGSSASRGMPVYSHLSLLLIIRPWRDGMLI